MNHLYVLVNLHLDDVIGGEFISSHNTNLSWDIVMENPDIDWDYDTLSTRHDITFDIIVSHPDIEWNYNLLRHNPNITVGDLIDLGLDIVIDEYDLYGTSVKWNPNKMDWEYKVDKDQRYIHYNPDDLVDGRMPLTSWDYSCSGKDANLTWEIACSIPENKRIYDAKKFYRCMSQNPNITWDIIKSNPGVGWHYPTVVRNPNISYDMLWDEMFTYINKNINCVNSNPNATWRNLYHDRICNIRQVSYNKFEGWNASTKLQHMFRRWCMKIRVGAANIILLNIHMSQYDAGIVLPAEICGHISSLISLFDDKYDVKYNIFRNETKIRIINYVRSKYGGSNLYSDRITSFRHQNFENSDRRDLGRNMNYDRFADKANEYYIEAIGIYEIPDDIYFHVISNISNYTSNIKNDVSNKRRLIRWNVTKQFLESNLYKKANDREAVLKRFSEICLEVYSLISTSCEYSYTEEEEEYLISNIKYFVHPATYSGMHFICPFDENMYYRKTTDLHKDGCNPFDSDLYPVESLGLWNDVKWIFDGTSRENIETNPFDDPFIDAFVSPFD